MSDYRDPEGRHLGDVLREHNKDKFGLGCPLCEEKDKRIRELEDILKSIQGVIINNDNVRVQAKHIGSDLAVHLIFERIEKALSDKEKNDAGK